MFRADNLHFARNTLPLLTDVSFEVLPAQLVKITGGNGSGKTTLLKIVSGLLAPDSGDLYWNERPIAEAPDSYREEVLFVGHNNALADELTPVENMQAIAGLRRRQPRQLLTAALAAAGLAAANTECRRLSAGQKRRAALARLLAFSAKLWLLDEPLAALDGDGRTMLSNWLAAHLTAGGMAICSMHHHTDWDVPAAAIIACDGN